MCHDGMLEDTNSLDAAQSELFLQVLFDHNGCIKRYSSSEDILREFYDVRMDMYRRRKAHLEGMFAAESLKMDNIARFIMEKIEGTVVVGVYISHLSQSTTKPTN